MEERVGKLTSKKRRHHHLPLQAVVHYCFFLVEKNGNFIVNRKGLPGICLSCQLCGDMQLAAF